MGGDGFLRSCHWDSRHHLRFLWERGASEVASGELTGRLRNDEVRTHCEAALHHCESLQHVYLHARRVHDDWWPIPRLCRIQELSHHYCGGDSHNGIHGVRRAPGLDRDGPGASNLQPPPPFRRDHHGGGNIRPGSPRKLRGLEGIARPKQSRLQRHPCHAALPHVGNRLQRGHVAARVGSGRPQSSQGRRHHRMHRNCHSGFPLRILGVPCCVGRAHRLRDREPEPVHVSGVPQRSGRRAGHGVELGVGLGVGACGDDESVRDR
mmetsp:Transcript_1834/g.3737  ORF Transcript_1834/g.3737 Transcript_1834/m.3737 type:complete len:265 (+) Transcript_1834:489-1283(+)